MKIDHPKTEQIPALRTLWQEVFGDSDDFLDSFFAYGFACSHCLCAMEQEKMAGAMYWLDHTCRGKKLAYLYAVATHPDYRGQGICRRLTHQVTALLREQGYAGIILVPAQPGLVSMYEKLGFSPASPLGLLRCSRGETPTPLRAVGPQEYNALRNRLAPEGSALLGEQALRFLASQAEFFAGDGWVLAAWRQDQTLTGLEYLGSTSLLPGIVNALSCIRGSFRIPGADQPFAMFTALSPGENCPSHVGFAFD